VGRLALLTSVRVTLLVAALAIFAIGIFRLPHTATTGGELVIGEILAVAVGVQMLVAALYDRTGQANSL
jgi:hypothetical protein